MTVDDICCIAGGETTAGEAGLTQDSSAEETLSIDGAEWVELFVREMMSASNMDDAKARAARALEALEKSILARVGAEASRNFHQVAIFVVWNISYFDFQTHQPTNRQTKQKEKKKRNLR